MLVKQQKKTTTIIENENFLPHFYGFKLMNENKWFADVIVYVLRFYSFNFFIFFNFFLIFCDLIEKIFFNKVSLYCFTFIQSDDLDLSLARPKTLKSFARIKINLWNQSRKKMSKRRRSETLTNVITVEVMKN